MKRLLLTAILFSVTAFGAGIDWQSIWSIDRADFNPVYTGKKTPPTLKELNELTERFAPELVKPFDLEYVHGVMTHSVTSAVITTITHGGTYGSFVEWFKVDKISLTNTVNDLAEAGLLCEVLGHKWESGCSIEARGYGCLVNHGPARHCSMCGREQYLKPEVWE